MERVKLDFEGGVAVLKFNHPEVMNAVGAQMQEDLFEAVAEIKDPNNGARCVLLTGEGRGFCAGANLQDTGGSENGRKRSGAGDSLRTSYHPLLFQLRELDMPIVTAVNGAAAGVGDIVFGNDSGANKAMDAAAMGIGGTIGGLLGGGVFSPVTAAIGAGIGKTVSDATQFIVGGGKSEKERIIEQLIAQRGGI